MIPFIDKEIKTISKDSELTMGSLITYFFLLKMIDFKTADKKLNFINRIKKNLQKLITYELIEKTNICLLILRELFEFFAEYNLIMEGITLFEKFPDFIKNQKFNSVKTFLFYFAYQKQNFSSPMVKELLSQELITAQISEPNEYLDFCMYCFFKGLYYIEKKNYFMATYFYCAAVQIGLNNRLENSIILNEFSLQMIRALCFLKGLSDFDINNYLFKSNHEYHRFSEEKLNCENIDECLSYLKISKNDFDKFNDFVKKNKDIFNDYKLNGLKNEAYEILMLQKIKETLKIYKKIKLTKLSQLINIEFNILIKVIKKKCIEGEINVKYNEENDVIEVFNIDPGMKENVEKTQNLYKSIIEGNKAYFISLRDTKLKKLNDEGKFNMINPYNEDDDDDDD